MISQEIGIVMLDNRIPRPLGDVGNPESFPFAVTMEVCEGADTHQVLEHAADGLLPAIKRTALGMQNGGAKAITTCCGFLAIHQRELAAAVDVPVATSSLLQIPLILQLLNPSQSLGVITANGENLGPAHFEAVGVDAVYRRRVRILGLERTAHLYRVLTGDNENLDYSLAEAEVVAVVQEGLNMYPDIGAFVLECTNLPPYSAAIKSATGRPVWDALSLIEWLQRGSSVRVGNS